MWGCLVDDLLELGGRNGGGRVSYCYLLREVSWGVNDTMFLVGNFASCLDQVLLSDDANDAAWPGMLER